MKMVEGGGAPPVCIVIYTLMREAVETASRKKGDA